MENKKIYETIAAVMEGVGAIGKGRKNIQQDFQYRGIDDVYNALNPLFIQHKLFAVPEVLEQHREERQTVRGGTLIYSICKVKYTFFAEDGSSVSVVVIGEGMDSGDKASNKAMSAAFKYACFQLFCIPTEDGTDGRPVDPDAETHTVRPKAQEYISQGQLESIKSEMQRTGVAASEVLKAARCNDFTDMTADMYKVVMSMFAQTPSVGK